MRIKLSLGNSDFVGFKNVNPFTELKDVFDNSATEIYIDQEVLSKIENKNFKQFINAVLSKLRRNGTITITGPDCSHVFLKYLHRILKEEDVSELLRESFGFYNCKYVEDTLISLGIKIESMSINNYFYHVKGSRQ